MSATAAGRGAARCHVCFRGCALEAGATGACGVRTNEAGSVRPLNYGLVTSAALDPVEKKPLHHFMPGTKLLSVGTAGCNYTCDFCQNWSISQGADALAGARYVPPEALVEAASSLRADGCVGVAFTYSEPVVWFEYVRDAAVALRAAGMAVIIVTNGSFSAQSMAELLPLVDAMNVDVKGFAEEYYRSVCGATLAPVKRNVEAAIGRTHVEVTTLLVPGLNDSAAELEALARWLASLNADTPLHLSRYFPQHRMSLEATPTATLKAARDIAQRFLHYVYIGNADLPGAASTVCPSCGALLIDRRRGEVRLPGISRRSLEHHNASGTGPHYDAECISCGHPLPIVVPAI